MSQNISSIILDNLPFAIWIKDINGKYLYANTFYCNHLKRNKEDVINNTDFDIFDKTTAETFKNYDKITLESNSPYIFTDSINDKFLQCYKKPLYENGELIGILGTFIDVTEATISKRDLKTQKDLLQSLFDNIPDTIFYKDENSVYLGANKSFLEDISVNLKLEDIVGKTDLDLHPNKELAQTFIENDKEIMRTLEKQITHVTITDKNNKQIYTENIKAPLIFDDGKVSGTIGISRDISYRKELEDKLYKLSYTDSLTNLYNRTYFVDRSKALYKEDFLPLSIIMGDVNGLKIINDSIGHIEGDKIISNISKIILSCCRPGDYAFRWGGDEIIMLLPNTENDVADAIIKDIYNKCSSSNDNPTPLSISLGSSTLYDLNSKVDDALKDAEDKVYRHKLLQEESFRSSLIDTLHRSLLEKSEETEQHTERLKHYAIKIGEDLGLSSSEIDNLVLLCNLHDIGKIGISENILMKPEELTPEEFELMKLHCEKGFRITQRIPEFTHISKAILAHHERFDGTGYPLELKGEEIPLISRIVSVVDSYDAMFYDRVYRKGLSKKHCIQELVDNSGSQFDPMIVESFLRII